jgi:hypothetical protein
LSSSARGPPARGSRSRARNLAEERHQPLLQLGPEELQARDDDLLGEDLARGECCRSVAVADVADDLRRQPVRHPNEVAEELSELHELHVLQVRVEPRDVNLRCS